MPEPRTIRRPPQQQRTSFNSVTPYEQAIEILSVYTARLSPHERHTNNQIRHLYPQTVLCFASVNNTPMTYTDMARVFVKLGVHKTMYARSYLAQYITLWNRFTHDHSLVNDCIDPTCENPKRKHRVCSRQASAGGRKGKGRRPHVYWIRDFEKMTHRHPSGSPPLQLPSFSQVIQSIASVSACG